MLSWRQSWDRVKAQFRNINSVSGLEKLLAETEREKGLVEAQLAAAEEARKEAALADLEGGDETSANYQRAVMARDAATVKLEKISAGLAEGRAKLERLRQAEAERQHAARLARLEERLAKRLAAAAKVDKGLALAGEGLAEMDGQDLDEVEWLHEEMLALRLYNGVQDLGPNAVLIETPMHLQQRAWNFCLALDRWGLRNALGDLGRKLPSASHLGQTLEELTRQAHETLRRVAGLDRPRAGQKLLSAPATDEAEAVGVAPGNAPAEADDGTKDAGDPEASAA